MDPLFVAQRDEDGLSDGHRATIPYHGDDNDEEKLAEETATPIRSTSSTRTRHWQEKQVKRVAARDNNKTACPGATHVTANPNFNQPNNHPANHHQSQGVAPIVAFDVAEEFFDDVREADTNNPGALSMMPQGQTLDPNRWQRKERKRIAHRSRNRHGTSNAQNATMQTTTTLADSSRPSAITAEHQNQHRHSRLAPAADPRNPPGETHQYSSGPLPVPIPIISQGTLQQQQPTPNRQGTFLLPVANQIDGNGNSMLVVGEAQPEDPERLQKIRNERRRRFLYWVVPLSAGLVLAVVAVVIVVVLVVSNKDNDPHLILATAEGGSTNNQVPTISPTSSPNDVPSSAPTSWLPMDLPIFTVQAIQESQLSPQGRAFQWLSMHPMLPNMTDNRKMQLLALATFYYAMNGERWPDDIQRTWMQYHVHECNWYSDKYVRDGLIAEDLVNGPSFFDPEGVDTQDSTCFQNGTYAGEMYYFGLAAAHGIEGTVPPEISLLSHMEVYTIDQSSAAGDVSNYLVSELLLLPKLEYTSLYYNVWINGSFPDHFWRMSNLKEISLFVNKVSGTLATEIGLMTSMESFSLNNNRLSGTIPTEIGRLTNLQNLGLMYNNLSGTLPSELGLLTKLTTFYIRDNELLSGTIPTELEALTQLDPPNFADTGVTGGLSYGSTP